NPCRAAPAALLDPLTGYVLMPGDAPAPAGASTDYASCHNPTWGRQLSPTYPLPGDLDYATAGAAGYLGYFAGQLGQFAPTANDAARGYYSADLGDWHIIALN